MKKSALIIMYYLVMTVFVASRINAMSYSAVSLPKLAGAGAEANAVNNNGISVGYSSTIFDRGNPKALLWDSTGKSYDISTDYNVSSVVIHAIDINDNNQIVGTVADGNLSTIVLSTVSGQKQYTIIPGTSVASPTLKINNAGQVLSRDAQGSIIWDSTNGISHFTKLPGAQYDPSASGLNDLGQVVGSSLLADNLCHIWMWTNQTGTTDLGTIITESDSFCDVNGINNLGQIIGTYGAIYYSGMYNITSWRHGFIWSKSGGLTDIGNAEIVSSINDKGQVVGYDYSKKGFIWDPKYGRIELSPLPGSTFSIPNDINNSGVVVGKSYYYDTQGYIIEQPTIWTPVPEPSSMFSLVFSLVSMRLIISHRRKTA